MVARGFEDGEGVGGVHVGDAVGHEDDVVVGVGVLPASPVRQSHSLIQPSLHVGRAAGLEVLDGALYVRVARMPVGNCVTAEHVFAEVDDGDAILVSEAETDGLGSLSGYGHPVAVGHGA